MRAVIMCAIALGACATPQQRQAQQMAKLESMAEVCHAAGFQPHTPEISQCALQLYAQQEASDAQRRAAATAIGLQLLSTPPPAQQPRPVTCRQINGATVCM